MSICMYHKEKGARVFNSSKEIDAAGEGWQDTPFTYKHEVTGEELPVPGESPKKGRKKAEVTVEE